MPIQRFSLDILIFIFGLYIGIDYTISGIMLIKCGTKPLVKPRLLGLAFLKFSQKPIEKMRKFYPFFQVILSFNNMKIYTLIAGILFIIGSLYAIIDSLFCK